MERGQGYKERFLEMTCDPTNNSKRRPAGDRHGADGAAALSEGGGARPGARRGGRGGAGGGRGGDRLR